MIDTPPTDYIDAKEIEAIAPRAQAIVERLVRVLTAAGIKVETTTIRLLGSGDHLIEVPFKFNDMLVQLDFIAGRTQAGAAVPYVQLGFHHGRKRRYPERSGWNVKLLATVCVTALKQHELTEAKRLEQQKTANSALTNFLVFQESLGVTPGADPHTFEHKGATIGCIPTSPQSVSLSLTVSHDQAREILEKYGRPAKKV